MQALVELLADLEFALAFSEKTDHALTFTVPDRDGDFISETIRYAWSGTPGDPLTRQYNGGAVATSGRERLCVSARSSVSRANLLNNADMESGTANWEVIFGDLLSSSSSVSTVEVDRSTPKR